MPTRAEYQLRVGADEAGEDVFELNEEEYDAAMFKWKEDYKIHLKETDKINSEIRSAFYSAKAYIGNEARRTIEMKVGKEIWENENPVSLASAIKVSFLGKNDGAKGNKLDVEKQKREFANLVQQAGQRVADFYSGYREDFEALKTMELAGGSTEEDFERKWDEEAKVSDFIGKLNVRQGGDWIAEFQFNGAALPGTLEEAFEQACVAEKRYFSGSYGRGYERLNTYAVNQRNGGYNQGYNRNNSGNQRYGGYNQYNQGNNNGYYSGGNRQYGGYNQGNNNGYNNSNRGNQGYNGHRSYAQVARNGSEQGNKYWQDARGRLCCLDHMSGQCKFSNCRYSHEKPVTPAGGNNQGQHQQQNQQIDKAAKEVQQSKEVRFANATGNGNPDLGGGGSRKPAGFTGTIASAPKKQNN
jgi:hypothetical protein